MRSDIENKLGLKAYDIYGLSEISGPGVSMDCLAKQGMHVWADTLFPKSSTRNGEVLPDGRWGAGFHLHLQGGPAFDPLPHEGSDPPAQRGLRLRPHPSRMEKVTGRSDDMLIIRGVNVFPPRSNRCF
jgi:phenylacetate-CoA ligase